VGGSKPSIRWAAPIPRSGGRLPALGQERTHTLPMAAAAFSITSCESRPMRTRTVRAFASRSRRAASAAGCCLVRGARRSPAPTACSYVHPASVSTDMCSSVWVDSEKRSGPGVPSPPGANAVLLQPGERVLDVGCGYGTSTLEAAKRVAPSGRVVGVDISAAMLEPARQRVAAGGVDNVELLQADAQVHPFEPASFDVVISRFGIMFFDDPQAGFGNLARALRPGGRLVFVCPQDPLKSEWVRIAFGAAVAALGRAPDLGPPGAPGPFALADGDRLARLLTAAGLRDVALEAVTRPVRIGRDIDHTVGFVMSLPRANSSSQMRPKTWLAQPSRRSAAPSRRTRDPTAS
jgi:SAM-dependent methyltransferase